MSMLMFMLVLVFMLMLVFMLVLVLCNGKESNKTKKRVRGMSAYEAVCSYKDEK